MKKHFIYMTTNLITNEKYIGKHYGTEDDSYLGSGKILQRAILKYGKENFKREILYISKNAEENNKKEKEFIKAYNAIEDKNFYNIAEGGDGGDIFHTLPLEQQDQLRERARLQCTGKGNPMYGKHHSEETKEKISKALQNHPNTSKKVLCVETNVIYNSTREAERVLGIGHSSIGQAARPNGNQKTAGGYHWIYI